jgi:hypothetical protein
MNASPKTISSVSKRKPAPVAPPGGFSLTPSLPHSLTTAALFIGVYLACLGAPLLFAFTGLATLGEVVLAFLLPLVTVALFFYLQSLIVCYERRGTAAELARRAWRVWPKLMLVSLPLVLPAALNIYLATLNENALIIGLRWLTLFAVPPAAMHLWFAAAQKGALNAWRDVKHVLSAAYAPPAILLYALGLLLCAGVPYLLLVARVPLPNGNLLIVSFVVRLVLALVLSLTGWVAMVTALRDRWAHEAK